MLSHFNPFIQYKHEHICSTSLLRCIIKHDANQIICGTNSFQRKTRKAKEVGDENSLTKCLAYSCRVNFFDFFSFSLFFFLIRLTGYFQNSIAKTSDKLIDNMTQRAQNSHKNKNEKAKCWIKGSVACTYFVLGCCGSTNWDVHQTDLSVLCSFRVILTHFVVIVEPGVGK